MVTINGVKATDSQSVSQKKENAPSINQVLDNMQKNYDNINYDAKVGIAEQKTPPPNGQMGGILGMLGGGNDMLVSLMSMMMAGKNKGTKNFMKAQQQNLIKMLLKNSNNPMLEKILSIMPQNNFTGESKNQTIQQFPQIDTYIKTSDYNK